MLPLLLPPSAIIAASGPVMSPKSISQDEKVLRELGDRYLRLDEARREAAKSGDAIAVVNSVR